MEQNISSIEQIKDESAESDKAVSKPKLDIYPKTTADGKRGLVYVDKSGREYFESYEDMIKDLVQVYRQGLGRDPTDEELLTFRKLRDKKQE